jgi:hypothetical protein
MSHSHKKRNRKILDNINITVKLIKALFDPTKVGLPGGERDQIYYLLC